MPEQLTEEVLDAPGGGWVERMYAPVCALEEHGSEWSHEAPVRDFMDGSAVWVAWTEGEPPGVLSVRPDCPASEDGALCVGYLRHPGGHTYALAHPPEE